MLFRVALLLSLLSLLPLLSLSHTHTALLSFSRALLLPLSHTSHTHTHRSHTLQCVCASSVRSPLSLSAPLLCSPPLALHSSRHTHHACCSSSHATLCSTLMSRLPLRPVYRPPTRPPPLPSPFTSSSAAPRSYLSQPHPTRGVRILHSELAIGIAHSHRSQLMTTRTGIVRHPTLFPLIRHTTRHHLLCLSDLPPYTHYTHSHTRLTTIQRTPVSQIALLLPLRHSAS